MATCVTVSSLSNGWLCNALKVKSIEELLDFKIEFIRVFSHVLCLNILK